MAPPATTTSSDACGGGRAWPDDRMVERIERIRGDRLQRWSVYAAVPFVWLALAFLNPFVLFIPPLLTFALWKAMEYGMVERHDPPDDPDFY